MLHTGSVVELHVFFDLGLFLSVRGLVDGHFDHVIGAGHDDRFECAVFGGDLVVIDGPEAVEAETALVEVAGCFHLAPVLVADAVVDGFQVNAWKEQRDGIDYGTRAIAGQKWAGICYALYEGVSRVAYGDSRQHFERRERDRSYAYHKSLSMP